MKYFTDPEGVITLDNLVMTIMLMGVLFLLSGVLRKCVPILRNLGIPSSIIAGVFGLLLGPSLCEIIPLNMDVLKLIVYHGLALVFISIGLQRPPKTASTPDAMSMGFAIGAMAALQGLVGMLLTVILGFMSGSLIHPGFGLLLPLGFNQGPGQALTFGAAWEPSVLANGTLGAGLVDGADVGLIIAALGFAWSIFVGIPLVAYGRKKGWLKSSSSTTVIAEENETEIKSEPGSLDTLTTHIATIAIIYLGVYLALDILSSVLEEKQKIVDMLWGFHFLFGLAFALITRKFLTRPLGIPLQNRQLGQLSNLVVDLVTCAALAAIQVSVLKNNLVPILVITMAGGLVTVVTVVLLASRSFEQSRFQHAVLWFGASTGTLPMGLALLRMIDPELKSPAPTNMTVGSIFAIIFSAPLLAIMPYPISQWPHGFPQAAWITIALLAVYFVVIVGLWRVFGKLRFTGKGIWKKEKNV